MHSIINLKDISSGSRLPMPKLQMPKKYSEEAKENDAMIRDSLSENEEFLEEEYPGKILFTIEETTLILNVSYEFIRSSIIKGRINAKRLGKRHLIHKKELSRIITEGV